MSREAFADRAYADYADAAGTMKEIIKDNRITPDEVPAAITAMRVIVWLWPVVLTMVTTLRAFGHMSRVGVAAFPGAKMAREIAQLKELDTPENVTSIVPHLARRGRPEPKDVA